MNPIIIFLCLLTIFVLAHFLADYPLQGDFLSKAKNRLAPIPGVPWHQAMFAHAGIHAGFVFVIAGAYSMNPAVGLVCAFVEFILHAYIDDTKCCGRISFNTDQAFHLIVKAGFAAILVAGHVGWWSIRFS